MATQLKRSKYKSLVAIAVVLSLLCVIYSLHGRNIKHADKQEFLTHSQKLEIEKMLRPNPVSADQALKWDVQQQKHEQIKQEFLTHSQKLEIEKMLNARPNPVSADQALKWDVQQQKVKASRYMDETAYVDGTAGGRSPSLVASAKPFSLEYAGSAGRSTCQRDILNIATNRLFTKALSLMNPADDTYKSSLYADFSSWFPEHASKKYAPPPEMFDNEAQKQFVAWVTQESTGPISSLVTDALKLQKYIVPKEIHAMSGGGMGFVTGGLYNADILTEALSLAGVSALLEGTPKVLDFGGSTGRSIVMLKAAYPNIEAHLSDPIKDSIHWTRANINETIKGYASPISPPTKYTAKFYDIVFAISIWSHYNPPTAGLIWYDEMHRIIKPGGVLMVTTHGWASLFHPRFTDDSFGTGAILYHWMKTKGYFFLNVFPDGVDWSIDTKSMDWGQAYCDPTWLMDQLKKKWNLLLFLPGRNDCNQDVLLLERKA